MLDITPEHPLRLLLSYYYYKDEDLDALLGNCFGDLPVAIFADSGAFSAYMGGGHIDEQDYRAWVKRWCHRFVVVAGPDVIGNAPETIAATERMLGDGLSVPVLPTFHMGESWNYLDYWKGKVNYLAFGGMVPYVRRKLLLRAWLTKAFSRLTPGTRVHGFGMTSWDLLQAYPWFSVDSSSWTAGFRYAQLQLFDGRAGKMRGIKMGDPRSLLANARLLLDYGLRAPQATATGYDRDLVCGALLASWRRAEMWLGQQSALYLVTLSGQAPNSLPSIARGLATYFSCGSAVRSDNPQLGHVLGLAKTTSICARKGER